MIGEAGDDDENVTFTEASNMMRRRRRFVMPKKFQTAYWRALQFSKNLSRNRYKWAVQKKKKPIFSCEVNVLIMCSFWFFLRVHN
jgi:hypothetical protein